VKRRGAALGLGLGLGLGLVAGTCAPVLACEVVLLDARSGAVAARHALDRPALTVAFTHSVLGTPVRDDYVWRAGRWVLVAERFEGEGYGLPHAAPGGARLAREAGGWRLDIERVVQPLVLRAVAGMTLVLPGGVERRLDTPGAIELRAEGCG
jgi:hypothetical protein